MPIDGWWPAVAQGLAAVERGFGWLVGADGSDYVVARWLFLRGLGIIYLIAFFSLWTQVDGLLGRRGILPVETYLEALRAQSGRERYRLVPTVLWLRADNAALHIACALGVTASILLILDLAPAACLVLLWLLYLSLNAVGREFLAFQWDTLLLEAGWLALLLAPWRLRPGAATDVSSLAIVLLWWLLFRLTFQSGVVKLTSGDRTWRDLSALDYHFLTQPLPTWPAWHAHHLPRWVHKMAVVGTYVLEVLVPLMIFGTREMRLAACAGTVFLQLLIFTTGNYNFFNLLTMLLALLLVDDAAWAAILGPEIVGRLAGNPGPIPLPQLALATVVGAIWLPVGAVRVWQALLPLSGVPLPIMRLMRWLEPFRSLNSYGLFRVMTTRRPEIVVEGSEDGVTWREYAFRYKPGDVRRRPRFAEPHQPRLDWQLWFAALSRYDATPWFQAFCARLLEGSPDVLRLLASSPFPTQPPRYVRALYYEYRFTTPGERRETGAWWTRTLLGAYAPVLTLADAPAGDRLGP